MAESRRHARRFLLVGYSRTANPLALGVWHLLSQKQKAQGVSAHVKTEGSGLGVCAHAAAADAATIIQTRSLSHDSPGRGEAPTFARIMRTERRTKGRGPTETSLKGAHGMTKRQDPSCNHVGNNASETGQLKMPKGGPIAHRLQPQSCTPCCGAFASNAPLQGSHVPAHAHGRERARRARSWMRVRAAPRLYAVAPERPAQIPHVDDQDELHHHEHRADGADGDGVGLHEADHVVEKDDVAVDAERAKVLLALLLRKVAHPPVERVAHAGGGLKGRLGARDVSAELVARRVLRGPDDLRLRVGGLGVAGALRATRVARGNFGHAIEVWVAAAELVGTAGDTLNLGKELAAKAAVPTPAGRAVHHDRLAVHVVDRVDLHAVGREKSVNGA
eukprot:5721717-Pleurochrysis_carterae.AAC.1